jgi:hypothetical protein
VSVPLSSSMMAPQWDEQALGAFWFRQSLLVSHIFSFRIEVPATVIN